MDTHCDDSCCLCKYGSRAGRCTADDEQKKFIPVDKDTLRIRMDNPNNGYSWMDRVYIRQTLDKEHWYED